MNDIEITDFASVTKNGNIIVEFYANGCLNCRMSVPILDELSMSFPQIKFYRLNVDSTPELVKKYNLNLLPTLLAFRNGKIVDQVSGLKSKNYLAQFIMENFY